MPRAIVSLALAAVLAPWATTRCAVAAAIPEPPGCVAHPSIDRWEKRLRTERDLRRTTDRALAAAGPRLERLRAIFAEAGVPEALALLPVIDEATNRRLGLGGRRGHNDPAHLERTARSVAHYLAALAARYGDWPLALAAYDAGVGRVDEALGADREATFWSLAAHRRLPRASRDFVPRFLAVVRVTDDGHACRRPPAVDPAVLAAAPVPAIGPAIEPGLRIRRQLTPQTALALSTDGSRQDIPDVRVNFGFQYTF